MSGMEGLGVVLGVLPLLISAVEHYEAVFRPFKRYKDFAPEVARLQRRILAQKAIFRSQCQLLLMPLTDLETTTDMLNRREHRMWSSPDLGERLKEHLGQSAEACMATMIDIKEELKGIQQKSEEFSAVIEDLSKEPKNKAWRKRMKKLRFSLSEPQLDRCLTRLRELNDDFTKLSAQTTELLKISSSEDLTVKSIPVVKQCHRIRRASIELYEALAVACSAHNEHQAHLKVKQAFGSRSDQGLEQSCIRFCVGLAQRSEERTAIFTHPTWFAVRTALDSITASKPTGVSCNCGNGMQKVSNLGQVLQREQGEDIESRHSKRLRTGKVSYKEGISCPGPSQSLVSRRSLCSCMSPTQTRSERTDSSENTSVPNFCIAHDLCIYMSRFGSSVSDSNACFGRLIKSSTTHELYLENQEIYPRQCLSFTELVASMGERDFADIERICLARNLALAVLQFHATPLLTSSWNGDDIVFFGDFGIDGQKSPQRTDILGTFGCLPEPYLKVGVSPKNPPSAVENQTQGTQSTSPIRNSYLFRLGIALLELAYRAPLRSLQRSGVTTVETDFEIADQYSLKVASKLGRRYARIVRKCIGCDFAQDVDLSSQELRLAVHKDVVLELESLVVNFEKKMELS